MLIAQTIIPISLPRTFDYLIPSEMQQQISQGMRVIVSFGKKQYTTALVYKIIDIDTPIDSPYKLKPIISILDSTPSFTPLQFKLWEAVSAYYQCSLGDIFKNETPPYLKVESETLLSINHDINTQDLTLTKNETAIYDTLKDNKPHTLKEISTQLGIKSITRAINSLLSKDAITINDSIKERYKPKYETHISLHLSITTESQLIETLDSLTKAKKQHSLLQTLLAQSQDSNYHNHLINKKTLLSLSGTTTATLSELIKKDVLTQTSIPIDRLRCDTAANFDNANTLSPAQQTCYNSIQTSFANNKRVLLHGVAYSGKTEIYIHLIIDAINKGKQALILVPENALTTQLAQRLRPIFGSLLGTFHNKLSNNEQTELWNNLYNDNKYQIIIGTKSSIFLPFSRLGLIIVDEEHDQKYKQYDINPRYHSRNCALLLAHISQCNLVLGSATPSIESYTNSLNKKLDLVTLTERYNNTPPPTIHLINMLDIYKKNMLKGHFSFPLLNNINDALEQNKQVILLQNRRGYASFIECKHCGHIPKCPNCNVSLSVHKNTNALQCHYCNHTITMSNNCLNCGSDNIDYKGFGTEQIEAEAKSLFPDAHIRRMDIDTMTKKNSYDTLLNDFNNRKVDILVGTQMVAKGLDFNNVGIVGILNADNMLNFPDFRAHEYAYQLIVQMSGRCGRGLNDGQVFIQTSNPEHPIFKHIISNDYYKFFAQQMTERELFKYPPYYRLIKITSKHSIETINTTATNIIANALRESFGARILGPDSPLVERVNNQYIKNIIIKVELDANIARAKAIITDICTQIRQNKTYNALKITIDIDPV